MRIHIMTCCILAALAPLGHAQPLGDLDALKKAFDADRQRRFDLVNANVKATKEDVHVAQSAADWYVARVMSSLPGPKGELGANAKAQREFVELIDSLLLKNIGGAPKANRAFIELFGKAFVGSMKKALDQGIATHPDAVVRAGTLLPTMARLKQDDVGDYLIARIEDKAEHDIVRLWALKAMKEYMPITPRDANINLANDNTLKQMMNDIKYVETLTRYITRPLDPKNLQPEEMRVARFVRREAIASLASAGAPAVLALKAPVKFGKQQVAIVVKQTLQTEGLVAPALLRVLANELDVPATLQEKLEAAHGLAGMKVDGMPEYNPDLATYLIGRTLLEFVSEYNKDRVIFTADKVLPMIAWKTEAKRLEASLEQLAKTPRGKELAGKTTPILKSMRSYQSTDAAQVKELRTLVAAQRPTDGSVFKSIKTPPIKLPE